MKIGSSGSAGVYILVAILILIVTFLPTIIAFVRKNRRVKVLLLNIAQVVLMLICLMLTKTVPFITIVAIILFVWLVSLVLAIKTRKKDEKK